IGESSSRNIDNTVVHSFQPQSHDYRWTRDHPDGFVDPLKEEVYVAQPDGFVDPDHPEQVYLLNSADLEVLTNETA
ncbi:hypothetical protein Tco_0357832, partial [Tanacetum coccineum]